MTHNMSAGTSGFDRWTAQALALTRKLHLVADASRPRPAAPRPDDDTDVEALAAALNLLPAPAAPKRPASRGSAR